MEPKQLLDNLSTHLKDALGRAIALATSLGHEQVTMLHLLFGLAEEKGSVAAEIINKFGLEPSYILERLASLPAALTDGTGTTLSPTIPELDGLAKKSLERAMLLAYEREHNYIGTEHLLYGILQSSSKQLEELYKEHNIETKHIIEQIDNILESTSRFPNMEDLADAMDGLQSMIDAPPLPPQPQTNGAQPSTSKKRGKQKPKALSLFAVELTDTHRQKDIDPVIGRDGEIERLIHILCRRTKNNPVLVGEPGVGKTAIVEGLAKRIAEGTVPNVLKRKKLFSLDLTLLISGTIYRGEFEARLKQLIDECSGNDDYILFIDELHNIIGAGSNQGTMDAANILKPALARGKLHCIGATTFDEYKKYIANDAALDRRFQEIEVPEPSIEEAIDILKGIRSYYEEFHETKITDEAIQSAVTLSTKYIHDYFLPDKAIDLLDEASAAVRVKQKPSAKAKKIMALEAELDAIQEKKEACIHEEQFEDAVVLKKEAEAVEQQIATLKKEKKKGRSRKKVQAKDIANVLARKLSIDADLLLSNEWEQLKTLGNRLKKKVIGQDHVVERIVQSLRQAHLGIGRTGRPLASFLFTGPSGVGKTKLAQSLAEELYFDKRALIRIDMTEFAEAHGVSKLLGSPAGYVGYKERNRFLDAIQSRPYSVVLFDEFDKAHADVRKLLYQILDEGSLTDSAGKKISFAHATIVLTSNTGKEFFHNGTLGFGSTIDSAIATDRTAAIHDSIKEEFGSSFVGRINTVCILSPLSHNHTQQIIKQHIDTLNRDLMLSQQISIVPDKKALAALATASHDKELGMRNMHNVVEQILHELIVGVLYTSNREEETAYRLTKTDTAYELVS